MEIANELLGKTQYTQKKQWLPFFIISEHPVEILVSFTSNFFPLCGYGFLAGF
jgi:hypothetical protein